MEALVLIYVVTFIQSDLQEMTDDTILPPMWIIFRPIKGLNYLIGL